MGKEGIKDECLAGFENSNVIGPRYFVVDDPTGEKPGQFTAHCDRNSVVGAPVKNDNRRTSGLAVQFFQPFLIVHSIRDEPGQWAVKFVNGSMQSGEWGYKHDPFHVNAGRELQGRATTKGMAQQSQMLRQFVLPHMQMETQGLDRPERRIGEMFWTH